MMLKNKEKVLAILIPGLLLLILIVVMVYQGNHLIDASVVSLDKTTNNSSTSTSTSSSLLPLESIEIPANHASDYIKLDCLACHNNSVGVAPHIPADHVNRTAGVCQICHTLAAQ